MGSIASNEPIAGARRPKRENSERGQGGGKTIFEKHSRGQFSVGSPPAHKCRVNTTALSARVMDRNDKEKSSARPARTGTRTATAATGTTAVGAWTGAKHRLRLHRQQAFALQLLAGELARAAA